MGIDWLAIAGIVVVTLILRHLVINYWLYPWWCRYDPNAIPQSDLVVFETVSFALNRQGTDCCAQGKAIAQTAAGLAHVRPRHSAIYNSGGTSLRNDGIDRDAEFLAREVTRCGFSNVIVEPAETPSSDTLTEAKIGIRWMANSGAFDHMKHLVIVANWIHLPRAWRIWRRVFKKAAPHVKVWWYPSWSRIWNDNQKATLRHPVIFTLREYGGAWPKDFIIEPLRGGYRLR